jgi:hypothetical protein
MEVDGQAGDWLSLTDAARVLGISERTLRRHVRADRYSVRHDGNRIHLFVPLQEAADGKPSLDGVSGVDASLSVGTDELAGNLDRLESRVAGFGRRLESLEGGRERLDEQGRRLERLEWLTQRLLNRTESLRRAMLVLERRTYRPRSDGREAQGPAGEMPPADQAIGGHSTPPNR